MDKTAKIFQPVLEAFPKQRKGSDDFGKPFKSTLPADEDRDGRDRIDTVLALFYNIIEIHIFTCVFPQYDGCMRHRNGRICDFTFVL